MAQKIVDVLTRRTALRGAAAVCVARVFPAIVSRPAFAQAKIPTPGFVDQPGLEWTPGEKEDWVRAHTSAYKSILNAIDYLETYDHDKPRMTTKNTYDTWFDSGLQYKTGGWEDRLGRVKEVYRRMRDCMLAQTTYYLKQEQDAEKNGEIRCQWSTFSADIAYTVIDENWSDKNWDTRPKRGQFIDQRRYICPAAFSVDRMRIEFGPMDWARAFTVIHELAHGAAGREDLVYLSIRCQNLAVFHPWEAIRNAQNYAYFAMTWDPTTPGLPYETGNFSGLKNSGLLN